MDAAIRRQSLGDILHRSAARAPNKLAVLCGGVRWTYAELDDVCNRVAAGLVRRGVAKGTRVVESPSYLVQQTAAIAVAVNAPLSGERLLREEAYALYLALLEDFGALAFEAQPVTVTRAGAPAPGAPVVLDGRWTLVTDDKGIVSFDGLPRGAVVTVGSGTTSTRVTVPAAATTLALP